MTTAADVAGGGGASGWVRGARERPRLTPRGRVQLILGLALYLTGANVAASWVLLMAGVLLGSILWSVGTAWWRAGSLELTRRLPATTTAGQGVEVRIGVRAGGRLSVVVTDPLSSVAGVADTSANPAWLRARVVPRRGVVAHAPPLVARVSDPLGLAHVRVSAAVPTRVTTLAAATRVELPAPALAGGYELASVPVRQGAEVAGVRDHKAGDPLRAVHWRLSARHNKLVVRELVGAAPRRLAVAVAAGAWRATALDRAATLASGVAVAATQAGWPVWLEADGRRLPWGPQARRLLAALPPHAGAEARPLVKPPDGGAGLRLLLAQEADGAVAVTLHSAGREHVLGSTGDEGGRWLSSRLREAVL